MIYVPRSPFGPFLAWVARGHCGPLWPRCRVSTVCWPAVLSCVRGDSMRRGGVTKGMLCRAGRRGLRLRARLLRAPIDLIFWILLQLGSFWAAYTFLSV